MPLYEYECPACEEHFELMRSHQDPPVRRCPNCKSRRVRKLMSAPAFQFKGSGWYVTDYAGKKEQTSEKEKGESSSKDSSSKDSSSKDSSSKDTGPSDDRKKESSTEKKSAKKEAKTSSE